MGSLVAFHPHKLHLGGWTVLVWDSLTWGVIFLITHEAEYFFHVLYLFAIYISSFVSFYSITDFSIGLLFFIDV